jgi:hypothetical protein
MQWLADAMKAELSAWQRPSDKHKSFVGISGAISDKFLALVHGGSSHHQGTFL